MEKNGISAEAYLDSYQKYKGLQSEFLTLKDRWCFVSRILENDDILPDIFGKGGIDHAIHYYSRFLEGPGKTPPSLENRLYAMSDLRYGLENIALIVSLIKSGFFQRTDSMDLPYVIAGIPLSSERSWGNELYLVAADKLVQNYLKYLNVPHYKWDRFVSWYESKGKSRMLSGGGCLHFRGTFHLQLSMDIKYNFEGFLVLPHELAHAVCRAVVDTKRGTNCVTTNALIVAYGARREIVRIIRKCRGEDSCPFRNWVSLDTVPDEDAFIEATKSNGFMECLEESLMDIIAVKLAGTSYITGMVDYAFELPLRRSYPGSGTLVWNEVFFTGVFLRLGILFSYLQSEPRNGKLDSEYLQQAEKAFYGLRFESNYLLDFMAKAGMRMKKRDFLSKCMTCVTDMAFLLGKLLRLQEKEIFQNKSIPVFSKSPVFVTDNRAIRDLLSGKTRVDLESRIVLDSACKGARKTANMTCPAALYSIAFNQFKS